MTRRARRGIYYGQSWPRQAFAETEVDKAVQLDGEQRTLLMQRLEELRTEHRDLDDVIARVSEEAPFDQLRVQRLKKRKLGLKDQILRIESILLPDIIA